MRKILWHSGTPWAKTGYGTQTAMWVPRLASLGYEVAISAFGGLVAGPTEWEGFKVYPAGRHYVGADVLGQHAQHFGADLIITLLDTWTLEGFEPPVPMACWMPLDAEPLSRSPHKMPWGDEKVLHATAAIPIALTRFGQAMMLDAGFDPLYVPHGIDTSVFRPREDRTELRQAMGIDGRFVIGIFATCIDAVRKGWMEQLMAFAELARNHKEALLVGFTNLADQPRMLDIPQLCADLGLRTEGPDANVMFADQYELMAGHMPAEKVAKLMGACDLVSACSWAEGFGLPIAEAQACGTPVVATYAAAMREVCAGWHVTGSPWYATGHRCRWTRPEVGQIYDVYRHAWQAWRGHAQRVAEYGAKRSAARTHALRYDMNHVLTEYWAPALKEIEARVDS